MKSEPRPADLVAIDAEWPVIEAELALVQAECRLAGSSDPLAVRAHRRAVARLARAIRANSSVAARVALEALTGPPPCCPIDVQSVSA